MLDILDGLNEPQRQAVSHVDGPLLVLAGAGSGKTRVITRRVAYLVQQGIAPYNVLAITFTNKASQEMRERVEQLRTPRGVTVCTFHALCARLLREFADYAHLRENYTIYDRNDQLKIAKKALEEANVTGSYLTPAKVHAAISNAKNALQTAAAYTQQAGDFYSRSVAAVYAKYEQLLTANNALDFDDLLMRVAFMLRDHSDIRQFLADRYRYVLIDEYQDTNHSQYYIASAISAGRQNICATGDPDQSIYAWRGADIKNILDFEKDYPSAQVVLLEENYRSYQPILTCASNLIANNTHRKNKQLFTTRTGGEKVRVVQIDDEQAEARQVAEGIEKFRNDHGIDYGDMAVFYRVNSLSRVLEEALMNKGIPYTIARGVEFYNRKEIKDMLAYLKVLVNPPDDLSCLRIINTPARGIGVQTIKRLQEFAIGRGLCLLDACGQVDQAGLSTGPTKKVTAFYQIMSELRNQLQQPVRFTLNDIYAKSGLEAALQKGDEDAQQARANVEELISSATEFDEENPDATPAEYLHQVSLVSDVDKLEGTSGSVTLMTLHAAKGLEFPVVFLCGCEEGMLPFQRGQQLPGQNENPDELEEERRLAFVGITRAMHHLTMLSARSRMIRGQRTPSSESRFLAEMGEDEVTREDKTTTMSDVDRMGGLRRRGGFYRGKPKKDPFESDNNLDDWQTAMAKSSLKSKPAQKLDNWDNGDSFGDEHETPMPPEYEYLRKGSMVRHRKFGLGKVVKLAQQWPDTRVTVLFHEFGQKTLVLAMANLDVMDAEQW